MPIIDCQEESLRDEEDSGEPLQTPYVSVTILCIRTSINKFNGLQKIVFFFLLLLLFPFTHIIISRYSEDIHIKYSSFFFYDVPYYPRVRANDAVRLFYNSLFAGPIKERAELYFLETSPLRSCSHMDAAEHRSLLET